MANPVAAPAKDNFTVQEKRNGTANLKAVPQVRGDRDRIREEAARFCAKIDRSRSFTKQELQTMAETLLNSLDLGLQYTGFASVCIANEFWREQVQAIDFSRRLLLLPHCLKHAEGCPADYDEFGLDCRKCGACSVADFKTKAEDLGYKVLVSEGTPIVLKIIVSGHIDSIVGVACLNVLEKAIDKILLAGIPCVAVPLLSSNCKSTSVDEDWVMELINLKTPPPATITRSYIHLLREANSICEDPELSRLAPRVRDSANGVNTTPLSEQERIAYDWLTRGGKRSRPFITIAAFDALTGGKGTLNQDSLQLPDFVKRAALAIEAFHKASLIHDDIEDDDSYRYGRETLHKQEGLAVALNAGDYLLGLGYRLISQDRGEMGAEAAADIIYRLSSAHVKLAEGQGAELLWRQSNDKIITPIEALRIYGLKTAPAFEAALFAGIRLAGQAALYEKMIPDFSKNLGIAFQVLNDLNDFDPTADNKVVAGQDVLAGRPTVLFALALESANGAQHEEILTLVEKVRAGDNSFVLIERVRHLFEITGAFDKAKKLVEKYRARAEALADELESEDLRRLLYFLVDSVLEQTQEEPDQSPALLQLGST